MVTWTAAVIVLGFNFQRAESFTLQIWISEGELAQICCQNPGIAFYFLRLTTNRLLANASRALTGGAAALSASS
jgi:hypothetical protein